MASSLASGNASGNASRNASTVVRYQRRIGASPKPLYPEEDNGLTRAAVRVWYALAHRGALANWLDFSPSRLAPEIEICRASIFAALRELKDKGFILRTRIGRLVRVRCVTPQRRG